MSHIKKEVVKGFDSVHPAVLAEGLRVAAQILALQGVKVCDHVLDWGWNPVREWEGLQESWPWSATRMGSLTSGICSRASWSRFWAARVTSPPGQ